MTHLCTDVCNKLRPLAVKKDIVFNTEIDSNSIVSGDDKLLRRVLINVIENAIKYTTDNGDVDVELNQSANQCKIIVKDSGIGIPKEQIPYIFDRFYRVDKARARDTGGSGLGLSIVQSIVRLHKGEIYVESVIDEGTKFTINLPTNSK